MKHNWDQLTWQQPLHRRPLERAGAGERHATQTAAAIRASANRLYMGGELARAAQLLMELEMPGRWT
jgi:hypothetical protein